MHQLLHVDWVEVPAGIKSCEVNPKLNELLAIFMLIPMKLLETFFKIHNTITGGEIRILDSKIGSGPRVKCCEVKPKLNVPWAMFMLIPLKLLETFGNTQYKNTHFRFQEKDLKLKQK